MGRFLSGASFPYSHNSSVSSGSLSGSSSISNSWVISIQVFPCLFHCPISTILSTAFSTSRSWESVDVLILSTASFSFSLLTVSLKFGYVGGIGNVPRWYLTANALCFEQFVGRRRVDGGFPSGSGGRCMDVCFCVRQAFFSSSSSSFIMSGNERAFIVVLSFFIARTLWL